MNRAAAWGVIGAGVIILVGVLLTVASYRFAIALVEPPLPVPEYGIQAAVAYVTAGCVVAGGVVVGLRANRQNTSRGRTVAVGLGALAALTLVGGVLAFILSAR
ncbi:MAG: hypothetical protein ABWX56_07135 [Mycetocola sp.]